MADNLSPAQRSYTMSRIRSKNTAPEIALRKLLRAHGLRFRSYVRSLPGRPDFVFSAARTVVFVNGDFWHGWRFPVWRGKLAAYWREKIGRNRARDRINARRLRHGGWLVVRVWEHQVERDPESCLRRIEAAVARGISSQSRTSRTRSRSR